MVSAEGGGRSASGRPAARRALRHTAGIERAERMVGAAQQEGGTAASSSRAPAGHSRCAQRW